MKQERIVKIFTGRHIDLDSVISISDVQVGNTYCPNDLYFEFEIHCKLHDKPITYSRYASHAEKEHVKLTFNQEKVNLFCYKMADGTNCSIHHDNRFSEYYLQENKYTQTLAAQNLQKQIDELVLMWKNYINQNINHPLPPGF